MKRWQDKHVAEDIGAFAHYWHCWSEPQESNMLRGIDGWQEVVQIFYTFAFADVSVAVHKVFDLFVATF